MEYFRKIALCVLCLITSVWQLNAQVKKVPQWERFEVALQGTSDGNPFTDVSLAAAFWQQGGDTVNVQGFMTETGGILSALCLLYRGCGIMSRKAICFL